MDNESEARRERILVVDDDPAIREVLVDLLEPLGFRCTVAEDAESGLARFLQESFELVVTDLKMPGHDGTWLIDRVLEEKPDTAVVAISGFAETELAVDCLRRGAYDFLSKPFRAGELFDAVERALNRQGDLLRDQKYRSGLEKEVALKSGQLSEALTALDAAYQHTLESLAAALDAREQDTGEHSQRVMRYTSAIAARMGIRGPLLMDFARGALLHDIGKIGVSDSILLKPGKLSSNEWVQMKQHPEIGYDIVKDIPYLRAAAEIILTHQEMFDGTGYPLGLSGYRVPLGSRIFAVADTLDAILSDRCYRKGRSFQEARDEIVRCTETQFDPAVVEVFLEMDKGVFEELRDATGLIGFELEVARHEEQRRRAQSSDSGLLNVS